MPLAGTVCCRDGCPHPFEDCLTACRNRQCVYPLPLLVAMSTNDAKRTGIVYSPTIINSCPRQTILKRQHNYYETPADYYARWHGEGVHAMIEKHGPFPGVIQERRISKTFTDPETQQSVVVSGQPDWWDAPHRHLADWKKTKKAPSQPYDDHERQINIYAWLLDGGTWEDGTISEEGPLTAEIVYLEPGRTRIVPVLLWTPEATRRMMSRRMGQYLRYEESGEIPVGLDLDGPEAWKARYCPFRGTGQCCAD